MHYFYSEICCFECWCDQSLLLECWPWMVSEMMFDQIKIVMVITVAKLINEISCWRRCLMILNQNQRVNSEMNSCGGSECVKVCMCIKLLLEKQNAPYANTLRTAENKKHCQTAACGVDAGAYCEFSTLLCWWDGFFFSLLVWRLLMHDWSSISILLPETQGDAPDLEHLKHLQQWRSKYWILCRDCQSTYI